MTEDPFLRHRLVVHRLNELSEQMNRLEVKIDLLVGSNKAQQGSLDSLFESFRIVRRWITYRVCPRRMSIFTSEFTSDHPSSVSMPADPSQHWAYGLSAAEDIT